jgi:hypothetical protein
VPTLSICSMGHDLVLFYAFKPGYSLQDLGQVIEANKPLVVITCGESSLDEVTSPILFSQDKGDELKIHNSLQDCSDDQKHSSSPRDWSPGPI